MSGDPVVTVPIVSATRAEVGHVDVPASLLAGPVKEHLLHAMVKSQLASRRRGTHATKTRGLVSGSGKKPWRQKGTGRARAGSIRSPIWAGGGTIFGPQPRDYGHRLPRSARRAALRSVLAARHGEGNLLVVDAVTVPEPKTKRMVEYLRGLGIVGRVLVVLHEVDEAVMRAARNLPEVKVLLASALNVYDVLGHTHLLVTRDALGALVERLEGRA